MEQGDPVVALGYPVSASGGESLTSTAGVVSAVRTPLRIPAPDQPRFDNLVQTDAALGAGNSGGPLVGADGRLVGVNTILFTGGAGAPSAEQGYAIGVDRVRELLDEFREGRSQGWFGAGLLTPPPGVLERERLPAGMFVTAAQDGTSAEELRLEQVLITAIDGRPARSPRSPATARPSATRAAATSSTSPSSPGRGSGSRPCRSSSTRRRC